MSRPRCFISYSPEDIDRDTFGFLKEQLKLAAPGCDILTDADLPPGANLKVFMNEVKNVECVLVLLSPSYKRKVLTRQGGAYDEYNLLLTRYAELQDALRGGNKIGQIPGYFELIPILWAGDHSTSVPEELAPLKYFDFVGLRVNRDTSDNFIITDYVKKHYLPLITQIVERFSYISAMKSSSFKELYEDHYDRLFLEVRANWSDKRDKQYNYIDTLFVRTIAYKRVESQIAYFIIGRKGSGKSTVADVLSIRQSERYKGHVKIVADDIDLESLYNWMSLDQIRADTRTFFNRQKCFEIAWEAFIYLCCIRIVVDLDDRGKLTPEQGAFVPALRQFLATPLPSRQYSLFLPANEERQVFFSYCFGSIPTFIEDLIQTARPDKPQLFYSDIQRGFTRTHFFGYLFGADVIKNFGALLETCRKHFLVTLDGFDTNFDMFRHPSVARYDIEGLKKRTIFEADWLRALLHVVLSVKQHHSDKFHQLLEFCIAVPKDRFHELLTIERDSFLYHNRYCSLDWSGIELVILLLKRLQELAQYSASKGSGATVRSPEDRLAEVWKEKFAHVASDITFEYNGRQYSMPLFFYVLRHTFWRPRDVLLYYAKILAFAEDMRRKGRRASTEGIRQAVREVTFEVVSSEFINEFSSTVKNIRDVIGVFERQKQFLSYEVIRDLLDGVDLEFATGHNLHRIDDKIEFLYQVGFLGICATQQMIESGMAKHKHMFSFNEGYSVLRGVKGPRFDEHTFVIHPIFTNYLQINTAGNDLVLELTWDYLHMMESLLPWQYAGVVMPSGEKKIS
jgi:hypothetical protein